MKNLLDALTEIKIDLTKSELSENEIKEIEAKKDSYLKNADEVEHTTNTGYGKELVPVDVLTDRIYNAIPEYATFLTKLPWFHGNNMGVSEKVPVIGEIGFAVGNSEWTTWAGILAQGENLLATGDVTITQAPLILSVDISKKLMNHSITSIEDKVISDIAKQVVRTAESMIINADSSILSTGNVNCDDALPVSTFTKGAKDHRLQLDNGIRKLALSSATSYLDVGTLDFDDFINVRSKLGNYSYDLSNLLLLMNGNTYNKTLTIDEFKEQYQNGKFSTVTDWKLNTTLAGVEYVVSRDFGLTEADGKQSATPSNNTKWGFAYIYKPAVQWGYGQPVEIDIVKIPWKGYSIIATLEFGFTIVNKKAGVTDPSIALGINATV